MPVRCRAAQIFTHAYRDGVDHFQKLIKVNKWFCIGNPKLFSNKDGILLRHIWGRPTELGMLSCGDTDPAWISWLGFSGICRQWRPQIAGGMIARFVQELMEGVIEWESWLYVWTIRSERGDGIGTSGSSGAGRQRRSSYVFFLVVEIYALALHRSLEFLSCLRPANDTINTWYGFWSKITNGVMESNTSRSSFLKILNSSRL